MKLFTLFSTTLLLLVLSTNLFATTYTTIADGDWTNASTWENGAIPNATIKNSDEVIIKHSVSYTVSALIIKDGVSFEVKDGGALTVNGELRLASNLYGSFRVKDGSSITATTFNIYSKNITAVLNGTISGTTLKISDAIANIDGSLNFDTVNINGFSVVSLAGGSSLTADYLVVNDSYLYANGVENNMVTINVDGTVLLKNYSTFDLAYTDFDANDVDGNGHFSTITAGTFDVATNMDLTNSTSMEFIGTSVNVGDLLTLNSSTNIILKGESTLSGRDLLLKNSSNIFGRDAAGILNFTNPTLNSGSCVTCVTTDICYYGQGSTPPTGLDLRTGSAGFLLPVEMMFFNAKETNSGIELNWATASEKDNDYFQIEQSADGRNWNFVAELSGKGDAETETYYNYTDVNRYNSTYSYYRLLQVDFDGTSTYSDIVVVELSKESTNTTDIQVEVYPNPVTEYVNIRMNQTSVVPTVFLSNILGQQIPMQFTEDGDAYRADMPTGLPSGNYFLQIKVGDQITAQQITIE